MSVQRSVVRIMSFVAPNDPEVLELVCELKLTADC